MNRKSLCLGAALGMLLSHTSTLLSAVASHEVKQWARFEQSFESKTGYEDPIRDVRLKVTFTAPDGKTREVLGFWDDDKTWRVRFSPHQQGVWTWRTQFSDPQNASLHHQSGTFHCVPNPGNGPFERMGELRLSQNRRFIEHDDGTPFFWLADTVWCGPLFAELDDWDVFLQDRVEKEFTAIQFVMTQWRMAETDAAGNPTFWGKEKVTINMAYFQRLDPYVDAINDAGLLAVPVLLWAIRGGDNPGYSLPESEKILLADYMIARYGAHQVIWFLGGDGDYAGEKAETWKRIGRTVFHEGQHRLATMHVRGRTWVGKEFRGEPWFDFISYQSGHGDDSKTFRWLNQGPPSTEWANDPPLPVINTEPSYEAHNGYTYKKVHDDHSVRRACYWSLLVSPAAGVTYGGQGIWGWHTKVQAPADHIRTGLGSPWHIAKDLPGSFSMMYLHRFFRAIEWWRLVPAQDLLTAQPGKEDPAQFIAAAKSAEGDLAVVYLPEGGAVKVKTGALQEGVMARWYHPRTGGWLAADKVTGGTQTFQPADLNDWVLLFSKP